MRNLLEKSKARVGKSLRVLRTHLYRRAGYKIFHFLHISKTGGSAIKHSLQDWSSYQRSFIVLHNHETALRQVLEGEQFFFFTRDPIERFVSGFNRRKRRGAPRYNIAWSEGERHAFSVFESPDELASALSSPDGNLRASAKIAMEEIYHVRSSYWDWFENNEYLLSRKEDLLYIGAQESLESDFNELVRLLVVPK